MKENPPYKIYIQIAFIINLIGIVLTFAFKGNIGVFGTLLIILALILAVLGIIKKKKYEKSLK